MNRKRVMAVLAAAVLSVGSFNGAALYGQEDAAAAFRAGKQAFEAGQFEKARDQFAAAAQTDNKNPEVFLWLGKAQYQLGQVDEAVSAWKRTAALAPEEPYANQMLKALTGRAGSADTALAVVGSMLKDELWDPAVAAADRLLADRALTDAQRVKASLLRAEGLLGAGRHAEALAAVNEVLVRYPALADPAETKTLAGRAKLRGGPAQSAAGVAALKDVVANHAAAPPAAVAHYELLVFQLEQGVDAASVDALAKWVAAHPDHDRATAARRALVGAYLTLAGRGGEPGRDAKLGARDAAALDAAAQFYSRTVRAEDALSVTQALVAHLDNAYAKNGAFTAAKAGAEAILKSALPPTSRAVALRARARYATELAMRELAEQVQAGKVAGAGGALPPALAEAVAVLGEINKESAGEGAWREQAALAERVRGLGAQLPWPAKVTELKPPLAWAVQIALPVVNSNVEPAAASAVQTIATVADDAARAEQADPKGVAAAVNAQLLAAVRPDSAKWADVVWRQVNLLDVAAAEQFRRNVRDGKPQDNAKLSQPQQELVAALANIAKRQAAQADRAFQRLDQHLQPWMSFGQYAVAEAAYAELAKALPESQRRQVELALVNLWVRQAVNEHNRLAAGGLTVPKELDPLLAKAMARLYELQDSLADGDPFLAQVRSIAESVVNHYKGLGYYEAAEAAAKTKSAAPAGGGAGGGAAVASPAGETFLQFQVARLREEAARRELATLTRQFGGSKKLTLTDSVKAAVAAYTQFIADHPTDPLAEQAASAVSNIAATFQQGSAHDAAIQIYKDLAAFAAKRPALTQAPPGAASLEERATFAALTAMENKARAALDEARGAEKGEVKPPAKITDEYAAAVAAYEAFIKDRPQAAMVGAAVNRLMVIATDWARVDAWDVADGVYAVLLKPELKVRDPERIEFARGMCQVGKVMPDHAREVLAALTSGRDGREGRPMAPSTQPALAGYGDFDGRASGGLAGGPNAFGGRFGGPGGSGGGGGLPRGGPADPAAAPKPGAEMPAPATPTVPQPALVPPAGAAMPAENDFARADREVVAAISSQEARRAAMVARMRDQVSLNAPGKKMLDEQSQQGGQGQGQKGGEGVSAPPVLSEAEIARQAAALDAAYKVFQGIRTKSPTTPTAAQARGEILVLVGHWRAVGQWPKAADLARRFLADNPTDPQLPQVRLAIAQDTLMWAAEPVDPVKGKLNRQQVLAETSKRFEAARAELAKIAAEFPAERQLRQDAQWQLATSFLTQAHTVGAVSPTLARGQYVRAVREMQRAAAEYADHPQVGTIPQVLWDISQELAGHAYWEEAISVWNDLMVRYPQSPLAQQAAVQTAAAYQNQLGRPLRAAEVYLEINYARGGRDPEAQNAIYQIGSNLKAQSRWVESLHVLQTFVASFPKHPQAGQALTMIGQIHQTNEAWPDAIDAYRRVISEFATNGQWVQEAQWSIAECTINLSQWREAIGAYASFASSYPKDGRVPEANRRISVLKDLARYQQLVDEKGAKAFDAQFQIASIVQTQLSNPTKAIVEYRKVAQDWSTSHLADDALYAVGVAYLQQGRTADARTALAEMAAKYPESPLADDALLAIGRSYEDEAQRVAGWTREGQTDFNKDVAQRQAYSTLNSSRAQQRGEQQAKVQELRRKGEGKQAELEEARGAAGNNLFDNAQVSLAAQKAQQDVEALTATQLADRQDKINASLRKAVEAYASAAKVPGADKAGEALLRVATIHDERLHDSPAAMATWLEIVRQFSGTTVAEEASWRIAQNYERDGQYAAAIDAYKAFLRNYRGSGRAGDAQFSVAENYEHLNEWVKAMDSYGNYVNSFPQGAMVQKAKDQITWIKTYRL